MSLACYAVRSVPLFYIYLIVLLREPLLTVLLICEFSFLYIRMDLFHAPHLNLVYRQINPSSYRFIKK